MLLNKDLLDDPRKNISSIITKDWQDSLYYKIKKPDFISSLRDYYYYYYYSRAAMKDEINKINCLEVESVRCKIVNALKSKNKSQPSLEQVFLDIHRSNKVFLFSNQDSSLKLENTEDKIAELLKIKYYRKLFEVISREINKINANSLVSAHEIIAVPFEQAFKSKFLVA